jgi:aldose 1-epimerase
MCTLRSATGLEVEVLGYGASLRRVRVPMPDGLRDVSLFLDDMAAYEDPVWNPSIGAVVGRFGNRIARGRFTLDGVEHQVDVNHGDHHLHGGADGLGRQVWEFTDLTSSSARLRVHSPDGHCGYPGAVTAEVVYRLDANSLAIDIEATTTSATVVNLTNHGYWNLAGVGSGSVLDHRIVVGASRWVEVDTEAIPTGRLREVAGTRFDLRTPGTVGASPAPTADDGVLTGYDHCFVIDDAIGGDGEADTSELRHAATVTSPDNLAMAVYTNQPGVQVYTGNFLDSAGAAGVPHTAHAAVCLETQHLPDSPNQPTFPTTVLRPGETWHSRTVLRFLTP